MVAVHEAVEMAGWTVVVRYLKHKNDAESGATDHLEDNGGLPGKLSLVKDCERAAALSAVGEQTLEEANE